MYFTSMGLMEGRTVAEIKHRWQTVSETTSESSARAHLKVADSVYNVSIAELPKDHPESVHGVCASTGAEVDSDFRRRKTTDVKPRQIF